MGKERLLFLSAHLPSPQAREAGQKTAFRNLECLARRYAITLVAFSNEREGRLSQQAVRELCKEVVVVPVGRMTRLRGVLARPDVPLAVAARWSARAMRVLQRLLRTESYQRVHCEWGQMAAYASSFNSVRLRTLNLHDVLYQWCERRAELGRGLWGCFWKAESVRARRWERRSYEYFSCIYAPTEKDRRLVAELSDRLARRTWVLGHHVGRFGVGGTADARAEPRILFWGALGREENAAAVQWLTREVFPLVKSRVAEAELLVVGSDPPAWLRNLTADGVRVTGYVEDPGPYFRSARVAALPLFAGAGVKIKVLECLAAGIPVVTTAVGAEGIAAGPDEGLVVSEGTPEAFASRLVRLLEDPEYAARLGAAAAWWSERNLKDDFELLVNPPIEEA